LNQNRLETKDLIPEIDEYLDYVDNQLIQYNGVDNEFIQMAIEMKELEKKINILNKDINRFL
jgi:predicted  nucleic acid-binding Zn-ribbon protein